MKTLNRPAVKSDLIQRLHKLTPESQRRWGKMTAHQAVCHLSDAFKLVMSGTPVSSTASPTSQFIMKCLAIHVPVPWPKGVKTLPDADQEQGGTKPVEFQQDMQELLLSLERFTQKPRDFEWQAHPFFGEMSEWEWMRWGYLHVDHHLRQFGT